MAAHELVLPCVTEIMNFRPDVLIDMDKHVYVFKCVCLQTLSLKSGTVKRQVRASSTGWKNQTLMHEGGKPLLLLSLI